MPIMPMFPIIICIIICVWCAMFGIPPLAAAPAPAGVGAGGDSAFGAGGFPGGDAARPSSSGFLASSPSLPSALGFSSFSSSSLRFFSASSIARHSASRSSKVFSFSWAKACTRFIISSKREFLASSFLGSAAGGGGFGSFASSADGFGTSGGLAPSSGVEVFFSASIDASRRRRSGDLDLRRLERSLERS